MSRRPRRRSRSPARRRRVQWRQPRARARSWPREQASACSLYAREALRGSEPALSVVGAVEVREARVGATDLASVDPCAAAAEEQLLTLGRLAGTLARAPPPGAAIGHHRCRLRHGG